MGEAKVSLILPIYNVSMYLRQCLDSVIGQDLKELEIICVNDGSTDDSLEIIREYAQKDDRIVVLDGPNGGYGKAMNRGLDRATGTYIGIVEPDDYVPKEMYADLYRIATENDLDFVKADFYRFTTGEDGTEQLQLVPLDVTGKRYNEVLFPEKDPECIRFQMNTWTGIYRRAFIEEFGIRHNETPGASFQDTGFYFQTFARARRGMIVNTPYYRNRRDNPNSSVKNKGKVYCMNIEYDYIRDKLMEEQALWERFRGMYWWKKYHCYMFTLSRIDKSFGREYMRRMQAEYKWAYQKGELDENVFTPLEWNKVMTLIRSSDNFYDALKSASFLHRILPYIPQSWKRFAMRVISLKK